MQATAPALSLIGTWTLSSKNATNQQKGRRFDQNENLVLIVNIFSSLGYLNGILHPHLFWEPFYTVQVSSHTLALIVCVLHSIQARKFGHAVAKQSEAPGICYRVIRSR